MNKKELFNSLIINKGVYENRSIFLKSGMPSNFYYDFGRIDDASSFRFISECLVELIENEELDNVDCLFTSPYKGITFTIALMMLCAIYLSDMVHVKMGYVRKEKKDHGDKRDIIGHLPERNESVILVDDVLTTGTSITEMYDYLKNTGCIIRAAIVLINRTDDKTVAELRERIGAPIYWISTHEEVMQQSLSQPDADQM